MFKHLGVFFLVYCLSSVSSVTAHVEPKTPEQIKAYQDLQGAAYHCIPSIARYTAERQKQFSQHGLAGSSAQYKLSSDSALFDSENYDDINVGSQQKLLACTSMEEQKIRNNTCVLGELLPFCIDDPCALNIIPLLLKHPKSRPARTTMQKIS